MTDTPTAKELFLALWQARMGAHSDDEHNSQDFDYGYWLYEWDDCVELATQLRANENTAEPTGEARPLATSRIRSELNSSQ